MTNFKTLLESILKESQTVVHKPQSETEFDDIISSSNNHKIIMHGNKELYATSSRDTFKPKVHISNHFNHGNAIDLRPHHFQSITIKEIK